MAQNATVFKIQLQISDMDRDYYQGHSLTVAQHPSETDERMMMRVLAFALHAQERLEFTRGLCADEEPDLWCRHLSGGVALWIDVGLPDERRLKKACNSADQVVLYAYGGRKVALWWEGVRNKLTRFGNLRVIELDTDVTQGLAAMVQRSLALQCTIQDGELWISDGQTHLTITPSRLFPAG